MSRNLELAQLAKTLTVNANGTVTGLNIDASNIDGIPNTDLNIAPEVLEIQVAAPAAGQDTAWLWTWEQSTLPYARRTITNSPEVQVPIYKQGTYTVNNFAAYTTHANMTQTHSLYFKWIDGAGTDNLVSWATSTGPISDTHPSINGGTATNVQRISLAVPATVTPPTLTAPNVAYTVANNSSGAYTFSGSAEGDNPNLGPFYKGGTYTINISATGHPFYFTTDNGTNFSAGTYFGEYTTGVTGSRTDSGTITFTVPSNAPDTLYYQCGNHGAMRGSITIKDLAVETNINGNYVIYAQHTQEGHKTPVEIRPIPSLVNQMCLVYDASSSAFVPQDLATYVENTPSFENKIREVAGTAELVVEDGSAVVAKVNVYDDSTYLPLTGNNAGDQAFATDLNILYIWDGSAWQQAGTTNSDDLTEGSTNLFFTDARADARAQLKVDALVDAAPGTLDTLNELAAALGDDANFSTTVTNSIATKLATADFTSTADTWLGTKSTTNVAEGTNLYYTNARADARIAAATTSDLTEGTNLYYTSARVQAESLGGSLTGTVNNATVQYGTSYSGTPAQGSFFFDSLNQKLKIYTGSAFVDAVPAGGGGGGGGGSSNANATFEKYTYSITSSTNAVSGADDNSETLSYATGGNQNVEVYVNGVKQVEGASNDYVATTGTSVTFVDNLASGDVVDIQVYELLTNDAFYLKTDTYTKTETNTQISTALSGAISPSSATINDLEINRITGANDYTYIKKTSTGSNLAITSQESIYLNIDANNDQNNRSVIIATNTDEPGQGTVIAKFQEDGNVGIGTTSPSRRLHVNGGNEANLHLTSDSGRSGIFIDKPGTSSVMGSALVLQGDSSYRLGTASHYHVQMFQDGQTQIMGAGALGISVDTSGNVGVGTSSPYRKLTLSSAFGGSAEDLLDLQSSTAGGGTAPMIRFGTWALNSNTLGRIGFIDNPNYGGDFVVETNSSGSATDATTEKFRVDKDGNTTVVGTVRSNKGTIQTIVNQPTHYVSINPVNTWAEASSSFRVSITPKYSSGTTILGTFSIPINPQGASNILMAMNPWYSTDGGTTKTLLNQGGPAGSRVPGSHAWFRSSNGYDLNDMQNHIIKFGFVHTSTATLTWGFYFRSEGGNTTYFCHSQGNNGTWGWTAPCYMELREVDY